MATATWDRHRERDRGRKADNPSEIPKKGRKDILMRVKKKVKSDHLSIVAAAMAYYALLAVVPAISALVLIYTWFSDPTEISDHLSRVSNILPIEMTKFLNATLTSLASKASSALGVGAIGSLLFSLWSASKGTKALIEAMNIIYDEQEDRGIFRYTGLALGLTLLAVILCLVAIAVLVGIPAMAQMFTFGAAFEIGMTILSWVILLALFSFFLSFAYRYSPNRRKAKWRWVSWGAVTASVLWAITSGLFSWYAKEFGNFNKTYGSLGAFVVLMMWLYFSSYVVLLGAEINAELEHQTAKDSTEDNPKPMGQRKAKMADTLGERN